MQRYLLLFIFIPTFLFSQNTNLCSLTTKRDAWIARDKAQHFVMSILIAGASGYYLKTECHQSSDASRMQGMAVSFSLGLGKEIYDAHSRWGHASYKDLIANLFGVVCAGLLVGWW